MKKLALFTISLFMLITTVQSQDNPFERPSVQQLVVDNAHVFTPQQVAALTEKLNQFNRETSTQILVYTTPSLNGYDVADFAQRLGQGWHVGQKESDNGIVIVFKPRNGNEKGQITLQTGYGIEPLIPDATANQIVNREMIPFFQKGEIFQGIDQAVDVCISLTKKEYTAQKYDSTAKGSSGGAIIILIVFIVIFFSIFRKKNYANYNSGAKKSSLPFWVALGLLNSGSHHSSGWGNFSSGSGSFGGGGGFGGFGGGSFGGGGASGSW